MATQTQAAAAFEDVAAPSPIHATYAERTRKSAEAHTRNETVMPGGTSRQAGYWAPYPLTIERAEGVHLWDVDGHQYIDLINNYTAMVHGHAYPPIVEAASRQLPQGTGWAAGNVPQTSLAEQIVALAHHVAEMNADTEAKRLAPDLDLQAGLHGGHATHRIDDACELDKRAVTLELDRVPTMLGELRVYEGFADGLEDRKGSPSLSSMGRL